jgi:hypothetical protein
LRRLFSAVLLLGLATSLAAAQNHPGWLRADLTAKIAALLGEDTLRVERSTDLPQGFFLLDPTEEGSCFLGPKETLEYFPAGDFSTVLMIGNQKQVHTLWFFFPIVDVRDGDKAFAFYRDIFSFLFPDWRKADSWAMESLDTAWQAAAKAYEDPIISYGEMIARQNVDGAALATTGVPPDLIVYRITTRPQCERVSDYLQAKPRPAPVRP